MSSMIEALQTVAAVSKKYAAEAAKAIRTTGETSRQIMFNALAQSVLADEEVELSTEDRRLIASFITEDNEGGRDYTLRVRLNARERVVIEDLADNLDLTVSDLVRRVFTAIGSVETGDLEGEEPQLFADCIINHATELFELGFQKFIMNT